MDPCEITPLQWHQQTEWEVAVAYDLGVRRGIELAASMIDDNVAAALERPEGFGGPELDAAARDRARELFQQYLGVGQRPRVVRR